MNWQKYGTTAFKVIIIILAYWFLIKKLAEFDNWEAMWTFLYHDPFRFIKLLLPVLFLTGVNISIRSLIWKLLVSPIQTISFKRSVRAILLAITGGSFTPAKLGEWVGKAVVLDPDLRRKGFFIAGFSHLVQNLIMVVPGIIALYFYSLRYSGVSEFVSKLSFTALWILEAVVIVAVLLLPYLARKVNIPLLPGKIRGLVNIIASYTPRAYFNILGLSLLKNTFVFLQLFLLLRLFGIPITPIEGIIIIPTFYLSLSFVPGIMFADIGVIGAFGIAVIGSVFPNLAAVLLATMFIWMANVGIPLVSGSVIIAIHKHYNTDKDSTAVATE